MSIGWTGRTREAAVRALPPGKLLPDEQPAYVASWIYVFGVLTLSALAIVLTSGAVLAAADDPDADVKRRRVCDANFFIGELALQQGTKEEAARLFRTAATGCPKDRTSGDGANAELKVLGITP